MECEQQIIFSVYSDNKDYLFELGEYETVGKLVSGSNIIWEYIWYFKDA